MSLYAQPQPRLLNSVSLFPVTHTPLYQFRYRWEQRVSPPFPLRRHASLTLILSSAFHLTSLNSLTLTSLHLTLSPSTLPTLFAWTSNCLPCIPLFQPRLRHSVAPCLGLSP